MCRSQSAGGGTVFKIDGRADFREFDSFKCFQYRDGEMPRMWNIYHNCVMISSFSGASASVSDEHPILLTYHDLFFVVFRTRPACDPRFLPDESKAVVASRRIPTFVEIPFPGAGGSAVPLSSAEVPGPISPPSPTLLSRPILPNAPTARCR